MDESLLRHNDIDLICRDLCSGTMRLSFLRLWPGPISATSYERMGEDNPKNLSAAADFLRSHMAKFAV